jgi:hypothetical protein
MHIYDDGILWDMPSDRVPDYMLARTEGRVAFPAQYGAVAIGNVLNVGKYAGAGLKRDEVTKLVNAALGKRGR